MRVFRQFLGEVRRIHLPRRWVNSGHSRRLDLLGALCLISLSRSIP